MTKRATPRSVDQQTEPLVSAEEVSVVVGFDESEVRKMAREGAIPGYKGKKKKSRWRFRISEVLQAMKATVARQH